MYRKFSCFVIGEGALPVLCAQELRKASYKILGVISPDSEVHRWAEENAIPHFSTIEAGVLSQNPYDYLFSIANRVILSEEILSTPRQYAINFHDAPLPKYAGVHAPSWALISGEKRHGITWHKIANSKIDGGDILKQVIIPVSQTETTLSLNAKCCGVGVKSFAEMIRELQAGEICLKKQDLSQRSYFPSSQKPKRGGILSWEMNGQDMETLVRALDFGSYPNTLASAKLITEDHWVLVDKLQALPLRSKAGAGTITEIRENALIISTLSNDIMVRQVRTFDGGKLSISDFVTRFGLYKGYRFKDIGKGQAEQIERLSQSIAKHENLWRERLCRQKPLGNFVKRSPDATQNNGILCYKGELLSSKVKELLETYPHWNFRNFLIASYIIYLSRISGEERFDIGFSHLKLREEVVGLERFFACCVPLAVYVDGDKGVAEAIEEIIKQLELTKTYRTYMRDLGARYRGLGSTRFSVVVDETSIVEDNKVEFDFDFSFAVSEIGGRSCWFYRSDVISHSDVKRIHDHFCDFLSTLTGNTAVSIVDLPFSVDQHWLGARLALGNAAIAEEKEINEGVDQREFHKELLKKEQRAILLDLKEKRISSIEAQQKLEKILHNSTTCSVNSKVDNHSDNAQIPPRANDNPIPEPIAVIGISGKFPGAKDVQEFWRNLKNGVDSVKEISKDRWDIDRYFDPEPGKEEKIYSRYAGFIDDVDQFDPLFFNISPKEAEHMEPQHRLFLQETWKAIEDAGYKASCLSGKNIGLFIGGSVGDYSGRSVQIPSMECSRIAYLLDWKGPCICIETACSSGLVALHQACMHIRTHQIEMAIVGGMNLMITPNAYQYLSKTYALSAKGKCFSFDNRADGTVFSESICSIVLKPLSASLSDNDHIYGVIKGSGINYDGKTNGITAPSGKAQMELETGIYRQFNINPENITMVEAHGTGTTLGDPIEVDALLKTFKRFTRKKSFCALGSVKSNIGHTGFASGLVGLIKVLLALKNKQIPPTINYQKPNSAISFEDGPFYINTTLKNWTSVGPLTGAISSFGFSGTNAHVVIEEGPAQKIVASSSAGFGITGSPYVVPLSARNPDRLRKSANNLLKYLRENRESQAEINLTDLAYTLQVGRDEMGSRLVFLAHSMDELIEKLEEFTASAEKRLHGQPTKWVRGEVKAKGDALRLFKSEEESRELIHKWIKQGKFTEFSESWAKGVAVDWALLHKNISSQSGNTPGRYTGPNRISLPTYPFAEERYWIERNIPGNSSAEAAVQMSASETCLHPLLHANTSDLSEQRFSSWFSGEEYFLTDHQVKGQKVLPGVAYLEMAQAAVQRACGEMGRVKEAAADRGIRLNNVVWARPIALRDKPIEVSIGLFPQEDGAIAYEIYTRHSIAAEGAVVHSQGVAVLAAREQLQPLNLVALQTKLNGNSLSSQTCYAAFSAMGIDYGPAHRGLEKLYVGEHEVLAKLKLPVAVLETKDQFTLHPSVLDSALQATIGIGHNDASLHRLSGDRLARPALPFALESLDIIAGCEESMWAWARPVGDCGSNGKAVMDKMRKLDIDLCDEQGNICVKLRGFSSRVLEGEVADNAGAMGTLLLKPVWKEIPVNRTEQHMEYAETHVFLCGLDQDMQRLPGDHIPTTFVNFDSIRPAMQALPWEQRFEYYALELFEAIRKILEKQPKGKVLIQVLVPTGGCAEVFSALSGLLKTAYLENPRLLGQVIAVAGDVSAEALADKLRESGQSPEDQRIRYDGRKRLVASFEAIAGFDTEKRLPWKEGGVYLITGGVGGLGLIFAREIAERVRGATLILTGRSALSREREVRLKVLERLEAQVIYKTVDVADKQAVAALIQEIQHDFEGLQGVIHSAGVIQDNFILNKNKSEFQKVLSPKVKGVVNVDEATKGLDLDFFILFSSGAGTMGNAGQADYATANAFMDAFARYRNALLESKQRCGQTLSINWPLWKEGGMGVDAATERMLKDRLGMVALQTPAGIAAFYQSLAANEPQVMVVGGLLERIKQKLLPTPRKREQEKAEHALAERSARVEADHLLSKIQQSLIQTICKILKVKAQDLDIDSELSEYGFDSITLTDLANRLNQKYNLELTPTVFFEYPTIGGLAKYLVEQYREVFTHQFRVLPQGRNNTEADNVEFEKDAGRSGYRTRFAKIVSSPGPEVNKPEPVAIVGMSGKFPMAQNLDEFWSNLQASKDCIEEIPKSRWDWEKYYGNPLQEANKTNIRWGGFIEGVDEFDPLFFGISPREAKVMDPQQRLLMTYIWLALEDAGYSASSLSGSNTGIFVGTASNGYGNLIDQSNLAIEWYSATGMSPSMGPNRMSYFLNFHGPSEPIDTACSSSLVAIHRAIIAIETGGCDQALVGGVNTIITPEAYIRFNKAGMLCEDGRCKTFSNQANGYVRGEGVGILFLRTLKAAQAAGDHIYGLVCASAENHGGRATSLTAPNPKAQAALLVSAYKKAGIDPRTVSYIEAHGTGTELGDPIEIDALKSAFTELYQQTGDLQIKSPHCGIGSVKTNIGHLELAAGVAGVIKVLLQFKHKVLVESLYCKEINPYIDLQGSPFYIVRKSQEWEALRGAGGKTLPRRAGVSSFGFGGANAHVVLEEYIAEEKLDSSESIVAGPANPVIILLSGRSRDRLQDYAKNLLQFILRDKRSGSKINLTDLAYTLQTGREAMEERLGLIVHSKRELAEKLQGFIEGGEDIEDLYSGQVRQNKETMAVFTADEELQEAIGKWIERKKLSKLLGLWVKGLTVDWNKLYGLSKPQRISAPTYPFARERYWVQPQGAPEADPPAEVSRLMCFEEIWQPVPPPDVQGCTSVAGGRTPGATDVQGCTSFAGDRTPGATDVSAQAGCIVHSLLCFLSDSDKQHSLRRHLETQNPDIKLFFISVAESFSKSSDVQGSTSVAGGRMPGATWRVEAGNRDSYRETFQSIAEVVAGLDAMLYLWPLENPAFIEDAAGIAAILQSLYRSALHPRRIVLAGEYSDGLELSHLESWIGFERSIGLVWPDTRLTTLIRDKSGAGENWEDWLPLLWHELTKSESTSVLYQQEKRCELRVLPTYRDVLVSREAGCRERPTYRDVLVSREAGCRERPAAEEVETLL